MHVNELKQKNPQQLLKLAEEKKIDNASQLDVKQLRFAILSVIAADKKTTLVGDGVLEKMQDGFGFLRAAESNYLAAPDDLYVSPALIKKYALKTGDYVEGEIQAPQNDSERYFALETIERVNGAKPEQLRHRVSFDDKTPLYPDRMMKMETAEDKEKGRALSARTIDLVSPTGFGQRSLVVAPPRTGKTIMLQNIAHSVAENYPDAHLIVLLIDRSEER
ncbi:MAG: transcription termination factor Rho, partial [Rickettsiales bacterium]|nr:transcription termination factor Rho [Rickettsiales bacterium]